MTQGGVRGTGVHQVLLSLLARWGAVAVLAVTAAMPVRGLGFSVCGLHAATGLPCPGCGMTRAFSAMAHGEWSQAVALHPFVLLFWPAAVGLALLALAPRRSIARLEAFLGRWPELWARLFLITLAALLGFGLLRLAAFVALGERFP